MERNNDEFLTRAEENRKKLQRDAVKPLEMICGILKVKYFGFRGAK